MGIKIIRFYFTKFLDFTSRNDITSLQFRLNTEETYEISVPSGFGSFFGQFNSNMEFNLEVEAKNSDGNIITYGSFEIDDLLIGVVFKTKNYTLKFKNTGKFDFDFHIYFAKDFSMSGQYSYPALNLFKPTDTFEVLDSPFITYSGGSNDVMLSLILLLSLIAFYIFLTFACKDKGKNYCKCCKTNNASKKP